MPGTDEVNPDQANQLPSGPAAERYPFIFEGSAEALGHAKVSTTSDFYVHLEEDALKVATELMAGEISGNCAPTAPQQSRRVSDGWLSR